MTGRTISQYQILEKLGKSGMEEAKWLDKAPVVFLKRASNVGAFTFGYSRIWTNARQGFCGSTVDGAGGS